MRRRNFFHFNKGWKILCRPDKEKEGWGKWRGRRGGPCYFCVWLLYKSQNTWERCDGDVTPVTLTEMYVSSLPPCGRRRTLHALCQPHAAAAQVCWQGNLSSSFLFFLQNNRWPQHWRLPPCTVLLHDKLTLPLNKRSHPGFKTLRKTTSAAMHCCNSAPVDKVSGRSLKLLV